MFISAIITLYLYVLAGSEILGADSQVRSCMPPTPGGVVSNTGKNVLISETAGTSEITAGDPRVCETKTEEEMAMTSVDYCGIVNLLRQLVEKGLLTRQEVKKITARIEAEEQVDMILFL